VLGAKLIKRLPRSIIHRETAPLDQNLPDTSSLLSLQDTFRLGKDPTSHCRGQNARRSRGIAAVLLQEAHMEHIVDAGALRQLKTIGNATDALKHAKWARPSWPQLALGARVEGLLRGTMKKTQPDPRPHLELHVPVVGVVVAFRELLGLKEPLTNFSEHVVAAAKEGVGVLRTSRPWLVRQDGRRGTAVDDLEGRGAEGGMERSIVTILRPRQPIHPRTRPITCNTTQIHGNHLVDHLRLAVRLWMESGTHAKLDARHLEEVPPHMSGEHRVPVADDGEGKPV
jgi:hypothetical protein